MLQVQRVGAVRTVQHITLAMVAQARADLVMLEQSTQHT